MKRGLRKSNSGFRFKFTEVKETLRYPSGRADKAVVRTQMTDDVAGTDEIRKDKPTINKTPNAGKNMEQQKLSFITSKSKMVQPFGKTAWHLLKN